MGYKHAWPSHVLRLKTVLTDSLLGLTLPRYDYVQDSTGFLLELCVALGMDREASALRIDDIATRLKEEVEAYQSWCLWNSVRLNKHPK